MQLPPAESQPFTATATLVTGRSLVRGLTARETTGTATGRIQLRDGGSAGIVLVDVTLAPNESIRDWFGEAGLLSERDVTVLVNSGTVFGAVWITPESRFYGQSFPSEWYESPQ